MGGWAHRNIVVKLITVDVHVDVDGFWLSVLNEN